MEINNSDAENIYPRARLISSPGDILRGKDLGREKAGMETGMETGMGNPIFFILMPVHDGAEYMEGSFGISWPRLRTGGDW